MEVRNLAEQSKQATAQVRTILSEIQKATNSTVMATEEGAKGADAGVQLAAQNRESIEKLGGAVNEATQVAMQVVAGGQQLQTGIEQIAMAIQQINQVTLQSLASTRQTEKSAQNLNELARRLNNDVTQYEL
jgi:methyl-accepting chemotaxis protein